MKGILAILTAIGLIQPSDLPAADYHSSYSSSHALVVGIDQYHHWPHLEYAAKDAAEVAAALKTKGFQIYTLTDERATRKNILHQLEVISRTVDVNSRVVFYFAGHGQTEDLPGGRQRGYIVPVDADAYDWKDTMLPMDRLNRIVKQIRAKHIFMAFDSCYSGLGLTRSIKRSPTQNSAYIEKMMRSRSIQILTAGSRSEQAIETQGHGLFTDHLLAALSGAADINTDGYITATEIYAALRPSITRQSSGRQTPQFGYIEGNGDIIFSIDSQEKEPSTVLIDNRISGIDVWAGSSEIGHRLPVGRHRLSANAGHTIILVKNGGQTIYRKKAVLQAHQEFAIQIQAAAHMPDEPKSFSMLTIANRDVDNYSNSIACDLNADGREEIITAEDNQLYAFSFDGSPLWRRKFDFQITLNLVEDWNRQTAIGLTGFDDDQVHLLLLDEQGEKIWQHVAKINRADRGRSGDGLRIAKLADIDGDGYTDIIAVATAGYALKPRGIIVYDQSAGELWRYAIGPNPQNIVIWPNEHGRADIIIGTYSPGDGNQEPDNKTNDMSACVISVDGYGKTNWVAPVGTHYTGVNVLLADLEGNGQQGLYAHKYTSFRYREDEGAVYEISKSGQMLNQFETKNSILSMIAAGPSGNTQPCLYAADREGNLFKFDDRLNLLQKKALHPKSIPQEIRLVGVHDYDGDGLHDILMYSSNRLLIDKNPLAEGDPRDKVFYSNLGFRIISQDFSRVIKNVIIAKDWKIGRGFSVKNLDRPEMAPYPFMALSDKIMLFNY